MRGLTDFTKSSVIVYGSNRSSRKRSRITLARTWFLHSLVCFNAPFLKDFIRQAIYGNKWCASRKLFDNVAHDDWCCCLLTMSLFSMFQDCLLSLPMIIIAVDDNHSRVVVSWPVVGDWCVVDDVQTMVWRLLSMFDVGLAVNGSWWPSRTCCRSY